MKLFSKGKDGGPDSTVTGYWLCEFKNLFSIVLLRFDNGSRDAYHNHAFNSVSWVISGALAEYFKEQTPGRLHYAGNIFPIVTKKEDYHQVWSLGTTWVLSFRGPWAETWNEWYPDSEEEVTLTDHREVVDT